MSFDLPPSIYNVLQGIVHGSYETIGALIGSMKDRYPGRALEVGCGTGNLTRFFEPGQYFGIDVDDERVKLARKLHPEYQFATADATELKPSWLGEFAFAFCHACLHHIDDRGVSNIIAAFGRAPEITGTSIRLLIMEPVLPERTFTNVPGYFIGKLDRGRYMRKFSQLKTLVGDSISNYEITKGPWYWPIPGSNCVVDFAVSSERSAELEKQDARRRTAHA